MIAQSLRPTGPDSKQSLNCCLYFLYVGSEFDRSIKEWWDVSWEINFKSLPFFLQTNDSCTCSKSCDPQNNYATLFCIVIHVKMGKNPDPNQRF